MWVGVCVGVWLCGRGSGSLSRKEEGDGGYDLRDQKR